MQHRHAGMLWERLMQLVSCVVPTRFISFALIGGMGVFVHMAVLGSLVAIGRPGFAYAQAVATVAAMIFNFFLNNLLTYHDRRLTGFVAARAV